MAKNHTFDGSTLTYNLPNESVTVDLATLPANIVEKMVEGRLRKYFDEITLLGQPFVKDPEQSVEKLLKAHQARAVRFERFELGEGIEKKSDDFVAEVMAQARGG